MVNRQAARPETGFTLIELSIVLVIIGLIVGGVLVGRDLILAASIRAEIAQLEQFQTAINTFRSKYDGLPGDLANASQFGFTSRAGTNALGDNDGVIETSSAIVSYNTGVPYWSNLIGEATYAWTDLAAANMIPGQFDGSQTTPGAGASFPTMKLNARYGVVVYGYNGSNYFGIGVFRSSNVSLTQGRVLSPLNAYNIDSKMDDGKPMVGRMISMQGMDPINRIANSVQFGDAYSCNDNDLHANAADTVYSVAQDNTECALRFTLR